MGLAIPRGIDFSGGVEGGSLISNGTFIYPLIEFCVAQVLVPNKRRGGLFGVGGGMHKKHIGLGLILVVFESPRTVVGGVFFGGQCTPVLELTVVGGGRTRAYGKSLGVAISLGLAFG